MAGFYLAVWVFILSVCVHAYVGIPFIENKGQVAEDVLYYAPVKGGYVFVKKDAGVGYVLLADDKAGVFIERIGKPERIYGEGKASVIHYPAKGISADSYEVIKFENVFEGVDLLLRASSENVEKLFYVKPGHSPDSISVKLSGVRSVNISEEGLLVIETEAGKVKFTKPVAYQYVGKEKVYVEVSYLLKDKYTYGFLVRGSYDTSKPLIIDPLIASTFIGGSDRDEVVALKTDQNGNVYVLGTTISSDFPISPGVYKDIPDDIFISKFTPDLSTLEVSTFMGGSAVDHAVDMEIDGNGNIYVLGITGSSDFPVTTSAVYKGYNDVFVVKISPDLRTLTASTLLGGSSEDIAWDFFIDGSGNIYITGTTRSNDFSGFPTGYAINGGNDIFISKIDQNFNLVASVPFGADGRDVATSILVDGGGNVYITGFTTSQFFPTTDGAYDTAYNFGSDVFITKFDQNFNLVASTYLGGLMDDLALTMISDQNGNIYVTGLTHSANFPVTQGVFQTSASGGGDIFIALLSSDLSTLIASTFIGGSGFDVAKAMGVDQNGDVYLGCNTSSPDFPVSSDAFMPKYAGNFDGCVLKISADLTSLVASTYIGGEYNDGINSILVDPNLGVYVGGYTWSPDFPVTVGSFMDDHPVFKDGFVSLFDATLSANSDPQIISFSADKQKGRVPLKVNFTCTASDRDGSIVGYKYDLDGDGKIDYEGPSDKVFFIYWKEGKYRAVCTAVNSLKREVSKDIYITVEPENYPPGISSFSASPVKGVPPLNVTFTWEVSDKDGDKLLCTIDTGDGGKVYAVEDCANKTSIKHTYKSVGTYTVRLTVADPNGSSVSRELKIEVYKEQTKKSKSGCTHTNIPILIFSILILAVFIRRIS